MSGSGAEVLTDDREWSGVPAGCPRVIGRPSRMSGSGREDNPEVREWLVVVCTSGTTLPNIQ